MAQYIVTMKRLNKRKFPVADFSDKSNIAGVVQNGFTFQGEEATDLANAIGNGYYYWGGGLTEINPTSRNSPFIYDAEKVPLWSRLNFEISRFWQQTTGNNITVAVIDTGIFPHQDLKDAIDTKYQKSFISDSVEDTDGHGTHVSGIIAARGISDILGVAPEAKILPLKIVNTRNDKIVTQHLIEALTYAAALTHVKIINLSLIANSNDTKGMDIVNSILQQAIQSGKIVVAASGNLNGDYISSPARFVNMISVSAVKKDSNAPTESYILAENSNFGKGVKTCCLGSNIQSCDLKNSGTVELTGTSMACAYMSGLIALRLQQTGMANSNNQFSILQAINLSVFPNSGKIPNNLSVINPALFINS